jgi:HSP20 family protein
MFVPYMNVHEHDGKLQYQFELSGLTKDDISIHEENGVITVSGEKRLTHEDKKDGYHCVESSYGSFQRSFRLPKYAKLETLVATMSHGLLNINVEVKPHQAQQEKRSITVS